MASYHTDVGHFSADQNYFATSGADNAPLHVPADGGSANGVYAYASTSAFPTNTYNSMNFWVDVVFNFNVGSTLPLSVSTTSLPNGTQSAPYNQSLAAVGGTTPYTWSLLSGTLPSGLTLSTSGQISGTPTTVGASNFTVQVTDSGAPAQTATQALSIIVGPILSLLALNPTSVVGGLQSSTGTVTLSGPAPAGGAQVTLSSSNTAVASVPSSATVPAGATSATFTVTTSLVLLSTSVNRLPLTERLGTAILAVIF